MEWTSLSLFPFTMLRKIFLAPLLALLAIAAPRTASAIGVTVIEDSVAYLVSLGRAAEGEKKWGTAWQYYEKASKLDGKNAEIQMAIADVCLKMNRMGPAIKAMDSATKLRPADYATQWKLVKLYFHYDQAAKVVALLPALHAKYPETPGWAFMIGKSYQTLQNYGKAISFLEVAVNEDSTNAEAFYRIGHMYMLMENYKKAIPYYRRSLKLDSASSPVRTYEMALVLSNNEQFEESLRYFQKAIDLGYPARDDFYRNMAQTMADAHQPEKALALMKEMLQRRPADLGVLNTIAEICYQANMYEEAIGYWDRILQIDPKSARTLYTIGTAYIKMGKDKEGQKICDRAIEMEPALAVLRHARQRS